MECRKQNGLIVLPVFYRVHPYDVRTGGGSYEISMLKHESWLGRDSEKVKIWKKALSDAGRFLGWYLTDGNEAELVRKIVQDISTKLNRTPLDLPEDLVGMDSQGQELKTIVNLRSKDDILKPRSSYRVFLSVRVLGARNSFLDHLCAALDEAGINTSKVDEELRKGEHISNELIELIEQSHIAIVVFSKDYAISTWCLEELTKIMECQKQGDLTVWPVYYEVDRYDVRRQQGSYARAMHEHESKFAKDSQKVNSWKEALSHAGSLTGLDFTDGSEARLIQKIVEKILDLPDRTPFVVAKYPVGINSRVEEIKTILKLQSKNVLMVRLWGQGGVGKTTLAKAICNSIFKEFQAFCFLEGVRKNCELPNGLVHLQEQLLSQALGRKNIPTCDNADTRSWLIKDRLAHKKVLIILDDVNDKNHLRALVGSCDWFGQGSRIIVTTRNRHLLNSCKEDLDHMHEVKCLKYDEASELFRKYTFPENQEIEIPENLVDSALHYAGGLPLGLEVLGGLLRGRGKQTWEETLQALGKRSPKEINDVLQVSYDELDSHVRKIFLDIACFFKGQRTRYIEEVLSSCYFNEDIGAKVHILIESSLIRQGDGTLQMHDLMQLMGMNIVLEKRRDDPRKHSRLWLHDDVLDFLSGHKGTDEIRAIVLKLSKPKEMLIRHDAFTNTRRLRLLILHNVHNSFQGVIHLPYGLRWVEWPNCASILEFRDGARLLVGLDLRNTNIKAVLKQFKDFVNLQFINFSECEGLVCMPNLHCTPYLEELDLHGCKNLKCADESLAHHDRLRLLNLSGCSELHDFPDVLQSKKLELLNLNHCSKLQRFPDIPDKIESLEGLYLIGTSMKELPQSIENLVSLEEMDLRYCKELAILPSSIYRLANLETLTLEGCSKLGKFPKKEDPSDSQMAWGFPKLYVLNLRGCNLSEVDFLESHSCFPLLRALYLLGNNITNLPTCGQLHNLLWLDVSYCQQLQEIPQNASQSSHLWSIGCESVSKFAPDKCDVEGYPVGEEKAMRVPTEKKGKSHDSSDPKKKEKAMRERPRYWLVLALLATIAVIFGIAKGVND